MMNRQIASVKNRLTKLINNYRNDKAFLIENKKHTVFIEGIIEGLQTACKIIDEEINEN